MATLFTIIGILALAFGLVCLGAYLTRRKGEKLRSRFAAIIANSKGEQQ